MISYCQIEQNSIYYQGERELRNKVLLRPIGIPDFGWEMFDSKSFHFVALKEDCVIGCVILHPLPESPGDAQLMQMAISSAMQKRGIGRGLMKILVDSAQSRGFKRVICHSRDEAAGFYAKLGFTVYGKPFTEVDILHRHMSLNLYNE